MEIIAKRSKDRLEAGLMLGLLAKGAFALFELVGGLGLWISNHDSLYRLVVRLTRPELLEDPGDWVANHLVTLGQNLSIGTQHATAIYLIFHGIVKLVIIALLVRRKRWAYPLAVAIFGLFILYQVFNLIASASLYILLLIVLDLAVVILIALEYHKLRKLH